MDMDLTVNGVGTLFEYRRQNIFRGSLRAERPRLRGRSGSGIEPRDHGVLPYPMAEKLM